MSGRCRVALIISILFQMTLLRPCPSKQITQSTVDDPKNMKLGESTWSKDINADGHPEIFTYSLTLLQSENIFVNTMKIIDGRTSGTSLKNNVLWSNQCLVSYPDMKDLLIQEGNISLLKWINDFFSPRLTYGAKLEKQKLKKSLIRDDFLDDFCETEHLEKGTVLEMITSQKENILFTYRGQWREDPVELVFIPQLNKFMRYGAGQY